MVGKWAICSARDGFSSCCLSVWPHHCLRFDKQKVKVPISAMLKSKAVPVVVCVLRHNRRSLLPPTAGTTYYYPFLPPSPPVSLYQPPRLTVTSYFRARPWSVSPSCTECTRNEFAFEWSRGLESFTVPYDLHERWIPTLDTRPAFDADAFSMVRLAGVAIA